MRFPAALAVLVLLAIRALAAPAHPEALVIVLGDQHSAYERTAQVVGLVDQLKAAHPDLPLAVILDGDTQEYGNVIARRSGGAIDFAMYAALAQRAPTIVNLGNHEPEFYALAETVQRIEATGARVISNITNRETGGPFAPAALPLPLGAVAATVVGVTTDNLATYRVAIRPSLDLAQPVVWARANFPRLLANAPLPIVVSHAGIAADRELLALVPDGTLFAGAHDHQRFVVPFGRTKKGFTSRTVSAAAWSPTWFSNSRRVQNASPNSAKLSSSCWSNVSIAELRVCSGRRSWYCALSQRFLVPGVSWPAVAGVTPPEGMA